MKSLSKDQKQERTVNLIVRSIIGLVLVVFIGAVLFGPSGHPIDQEFLHDRVKAGTLFDWIGVIGFIGTTLFMVTGGKPIYKEDIYTAKGSVAPALITFAALVLSVVLFWNL